MPEANVIAGGPASKRSNSRPSDPYKGWAAVGWFGLLFAVIGLTDVALYWYPLAFGSPEWEFGTVAASFSALPLATIGLAAVVGALMVNPSRGLMIATGVALVLLTLGIGLAFGMFVMHIPMAVPAAADGPQGSAVYRGIIRTVTKGVGFGSAYVIAAVMLFRHLPQKV